MDSPSLSALHLLPDWRQRILEDHENEGKLSGVRRWPVKLLRNAGRRAVWNMSSLMGVNSNGVAGQACRTLEVYLARHVQDSLSMILDNEDWEEFKRALASRFPLLIASCVQLAAKMSTAGVQVNPSIIRSSLICRGVVHTLDDIVSSEYQVFKTLGFRMPLWTSVDVAQLLALETGMPSNMMDGVTLVVDITECRRDRLNDRVLALAGLSPEIAAAHRSWVRTLHLCAGAVVASARYLTPPGSDPCSNLIPQLASLTRAPNAYVACLCDVILAHILIDDLPDVSPRIIKRKRTIWQSGNC